MEDAQGPRPLSADDDAWARRAARGDRAAFTPLVRRYEAQIRGFLARVTRSPAHADDLAQETFQQAWEKAALFDGRGSYRAWLFRIAWTTYLMDVRRNRGRASWQGDATAAAYSAPQPAEILDLEPALALLPPPERAAVLLCYGAGFSHSEAATALAVPLGTLKSQANRGRERLRRLIEGEADE